MHLLDLGTVLVFASLWMPYRVFFVSFSFTFAGSVRILLWEMSSLMMSYLFVIVSLIASASF